MDIQFNPHGWGPVAGGRLPIFEGVPYSHFDKKDRQVRPADFLSATTTTSTNKFQRRYETDFTYRHDAAEENTFQLVDTSRALNRSKPAAKRQAINKPQSRAYNFRSQHGGKQGKFVGRNKPGFRKRDRRQDRNPSLAIEPEWELVYELNLADLTKLQANPPSTTDLYTCGHVDQYDDSYDKLTVRTASRLRRCANKLFYYVTSKEDPILEKYAVEGAGNVFATDAILAQLMAAPRSVFSWDIVAQKINGMVFLDKREDSSFDLLTVSETAQDPPGYGDDVEEYNHPDKLALEATLINQNFSQQILTDNQGEGQRKIFEPNPFYEEGQDSSVEPASVAYTYRQFTMGSIQIVARCEVHGWVGKRDANSFITAYALNEWDSRYSNGVNWRQKIDTTKGAVLGNEMKNNNCKVAKWTAQSILANADFMKIGYVSRAAPNNPNDHQILATQSFRPKELANQLGMNPINVWGILKMFCETLLSMEDGKYLILKDPLKQAIRIYSVPINSFEEDYDEEEEGGEDEEGRVDGEQNEEDVAGAAAGDA
jgi:translation initiation factor 3 subunit D